METAVLTEGEVVSLREITSDDSEGNTKIYYAPEVVFTTEDNQEISFVSTSRSNPPLYSTGEQVPIAYQPDRPNDARINNGDNSIIAYILGAVGAILILSGLYVGFLYFKRKRQIAYLQDNGKKITAQVTKIAQNTSYAVNGVHPYLITAEYFDEAKDTVYVFTSDNIWFDPSSHTGETVEVLVNPQDYTVYQMDTSFLPQRV